MQHIHLYHGRAVPFFTAILLLFSLGTTVAQAAVSPLSITSATYNKKTNKLVVKTKIKGGVTGNLLLLHGEGGILADQSAAKKQTFTIQKAQLGQIPCSVEARVGNLSVSKAVVGASADCGKTPICKITAPIAGTAVQAGSKVSFNAQVKLKDKKANPLKYEYEWDFAGGAMGHPTGLSAEATFIRNNSNYRVRFSATDAKGRRCESAVDVVVGSPPSSLPEKVAEQAAPKRGEELAGTLDDIAVLPFQEWSMQHEGDMRSVQNGYMTFVPLVNNIRAYAYKKALKPIPLDDNQIEMRYSAASNPLDPVGPDSINSTSRNWPLTAMSLTSAEVQKTDIWDIYSRTDKSNVTDVAGKYKATPWIMDPNRAGGLVQPDEGFFKYKATNNTGDMGHNHGTEPDNDVNNVDHGRFMPGKADPFKTNEPQSFSKFMATNAVGGSAGWFSANLIPKTDTDDKGRINPFSLMRVEAVQKGSNTVLAKTDGVLSSGRDMHCRQCHAKGGIAAPENPPHTIKACRSSAFGLVSDPRRDLLKRVPFPACDKPKYFSVQDIGGDPNNLYDVEYAAALNYSSIHEFYDGIYFLTLMQQGSLDINLYLKDSEGNFLKDAAGNFVPNPNAGKTIADYPANCDGCHFSALNKDVYGKSWFDGGRNDIKDPAYYPNYSVTMHRFHGELQWNDNKDGIVRDANGAFVRYEWAKGTGSPNRNPKTLFPFLVRMASNFLWRKTA